MQASEQDAPASASPKVGAVGALIGLIADSVGLYLAATQNWSAAAYTGAAALGGAILFFVFLRAPFSRAVVLLALIPAVLGAGVLGAAVGHWLTPPTVKTVAEQTSPSQTPSATTVTTTASSSVGSSSPAATSSSAPPSSSTKLAEGARFLNTVRALNTNAVTSPLAVTIGTQSYPDSLAMGCSKAGAAATFAVAGYTTLKADVGLDNGQGSGAATNGYTSTIRVTAENDRQLGDDIVVSVGKPAQMDINLAGATQITIRCTLSDPRSSSGSYYQVAFGDARLRK